MARYIKFWGETPYCGTDYEEYEEFPDDVTDAELDEEAEALGKNNVDAYEYLVEDDMDEESVFEEYDFYYQNCDWGWEEVDEDTYFNQG